MTEHTDAHMSAESLMTPPHLCRLMFLTGRFKTSGDSEFVVRFCFISDTFYNSRASLCIFSPPRSHLSPRLSSSFLTRSQQHFLSVFLNPLFFFFPLLPEQSGLAAPPPTPSAVSGADGGEAKHSGLRGEGAEARAEMEYDHITLTDQWRAVDCR